MCHTSYYSTVTGIRVVDLCVYHPPWATKMCVEDKMVLASLDLCLIMDADGGPVCVYHPPWQSGCVEDKMMLASLALCLIILTA